MFYVYKYTISPSCLQIFNVNYGALRHNYDSFITLVLQNYIIGFNFTRQNNSRVCRGLSTTKVIL